MSSLPTAVLWDLDGTIIDTEPYWIECEYELVSQFGGQWSDADAHSIVGFDLLEAAAVIRERGGVPLPPQAIVERLVAGVVARLRQNMPFRPGARELLAALNRTGVPCALVTMSWRSITDEVLRQMPPGSFQSVITGDSVLNGKPHPEPYRRAAADLGVDPLSCVAIEDSPTGIASAEAAGCVVVAVPNLLPLDPAGHRVLLPSLVGVSPEDLGEFVETTPPPTGAGAVPPPSRPPRRMTDAERRRWTRGGLLAGRGRLVLAAALLLLLTLGGIWWLTSRESEQSYEPGPFNVHTWVRSNALEFSIEDLGVQYNQLHQVSPFWYEVTGTATIVTSSDADADEVDEFLSLARDRGVPVIASLFDQTEAGVMAGIIADPVQRSAHIEAIAAFARQHDFEGIDLDYEQFAFRASERAAWATIRSDFVTFVEELSARLATDGRILVVTVPPIYDTGQSEDSGYWVYDYGGLAPHVDSLRIMAYDYRNTSSEPGPVAPRDWVEGIVDAATEAAGGPEKLVLGLPMFGYNWVTGTTGTCPARAEGDISQALRRIKQVLQERDVSEVTVDPATGDSSFTYDLVQEDATTSCTQSREVHFLDDAELRVRMQMSIDKGMKGVALFAFGYEDDVVFEDIAAINATLSTTVPPT